MSSTFYVPFLRFPGLTPERLGYLYHSGCRRDILLDGLCHVDLATQLLSEFGFLGWRIGGGDDNIAHGGALWVSEEAYEATFNPMARSDPSSPGAIVWADAERLDPAVDLAGVFDHNWKPPRGFRILFGENVSTRPDLPSPLKLPRVARQRIV